MNSYNYESLCDRIRKQPDWKATALCTVCAEKVSSIVVGLGLPATWHVVEKCIDFAWSSLLHPVDNEQGLQLIRELEATCEWRCDDPSYLPFAVTRALDFVRFALWAATSVAPAKQVERALSLLLEVAESFDTSAARFPDKETAMSLGVQLRKSEESSQERLVKMVESVSMASNQVIGDLREEARSIGELFRGLLPLYCYYYVRG